MKFSIVIPCYNRPKMIRRAIESCLEQTYADFEVLVIDDNSDNPVSEVCRDIADLRIKYLRNPTNVGPAASRNRGVQAATGDYVSFLDSDDVYFRNRLAVVAEIIRDEPDVPLIFHFQLRQIGDGASDLLIPGRAPLPNERLDEYVLLNGNFIQTNSFIVRRDLALKVQFDPACIAYEDSKYIIECWLNAGTYAFCSAVLGTYHDDRRVSRLSKQRAISRFDGLLAFSKSHCSANATAGLVAFIAAEMSFWQSPFTVAKFLRHGHRCGVSLTRTFVYLARSMFGVLKVEWAIYYLRTVRVLFGRKRPSSSSLDVSLTNARSSGGKS